MPRKQECLEQMRVIGVWISVGQGTSEDQILLEKLASEIKAIDSHR